jgi:hypothetical protein
MSSEAWKKRKIGSDYTTSFKEHVDDKTNNSWIPYNSCSQTFQLAYHNMLFNIFNVPPIIILCTVTVLPAILSSFRCTATREIIVALFVKQDDILTAWTIVYACACVMCVCLGFIFILFFFIFRFFLTKPVYHWTVADVPLAVRVPQFDKPCLRISQQSFNIPLWQRFRNFYSLRLP